METHSTIINAFFIKRAQISLHFLKNISHFWRAGKGLLGLRYLTHLSLAANQLSSCAGLAGLPLVSLCLDDNALQFLDHLTDLPLLEKLSVARNKVESLDGLQFCQRLASLECAGNCVERVRECEFLAELPLLTHLALKGNPCAELPFYRRRVVVRLQRLSSLDDEDVASEDKVKAVNIHGGDESDLGHRKDTFKKYFAGTDAVWEDTLPPFVESEPCPKSSRDLARKARARQPSDDEEVAAASWSEEDAAAQLATLEEATAAAFTGTQQEINTNAGAAQENSCIFHKELESSCIFHKELQQVENNCIFKKELQRRSLDARAE